MSEVKYTEEEIEKIKDRILEALEMVIDPELGIDIVNLGLIYDIRFQQDGYTEIDMTLTTMGCPLADLLTDQIYDAMKEVPEVTKTDGSSVTHTYRYDGYKILTYSSGKKGVRYLFTATDSQAADNPYQYIQFSDHQIDPTRSAHFQDRKSTRLNSSHSRASRMPSSA